MRSLFARWIGSAVYPPLTAEDRTARAELCERLFAAAMGAVVTDATIAATLTWRARGGVGATLLAFAVSAAVLAFPVTLAALPLVAVLRRAEVRALGARLGDALAGGSEHRGVALALYGAALASGVTWAARFGVRAYDHQTAHTAALLTLASGAVCMGAAAVLVALTVRPVARALAPIARRAPWIPARAARDVALAAAAIGASFALLGPRYAAPPAAALAGLALAPVLFALRRRARGAPSRAAGWWLAPLVLGPLAALAFPRLPGVVELAVLYRAPYASLVLGAARGAVDRDKDGYSPILGGGDCDDHDPSIHPNAYDRPGDGVDENCSGADAQRYAVAAPVMPPAPRPPPPRTNIVLVQMDALRPDHVHFAGYPRPTTPKMDRFRAGATWFADAYTPAPTTRLAMAAIFTGRDVAAIPQKRGPGIDFELLPDAVTLAERLAPLGYDRVGLTISYVLQHIKEMGQGFRRWETPWPVDEWERTYGKAAALTTDAALEYLASRDPAKNEPYLLFVHYQCTHDPYVKHLTWDFGDRDVDRYDSALAYCDDHFGRLVDALDARADKDRTAVIVFSDHGELFGEHGVDHHGNSLYEPDVRALLLARVPGGTIGTVEDRVSLVDLAPTVLALAGAPADPASPAWSLVPYTQLPGKGDGGRRALFLYADMWHGVAHYEARGVVDGAFKLTRDLGSGQVQLFDLARDPGELSDLSEARPREKNRLSEELDAWESHLLWSRVTLGSR